MPDAMTSIAELVEELSSAVEFQETPREYDDDDYENFIIRAIRRLYVDTGRAKEYSSDKIVVVRGAKYFNAKLGADEIEYVLLIAQILFYMAVRASVDAMVSYTTDALSVTGGDKPYKNIAKTIEDLEYERRRIYYTMTDYTLEHNYHEPVGWK